MAVWNKELFNKMLDFLEDTCYDVLSCEVNLQKDIKLNKDKNFTIVDKETKETFMEMTKALDAINVLRTFDYDDYNDERDVFETLFGQRK